MRYCKPVLTEMQKKVLFCYVAGLGVQETAVLLERSPHTIKIHRLHLCTRLGAENMVHAAALYLTALIRVEEFIDNLEVVA